jgi:hypothetical protein
VTVPPIWVTVPSGFRRANANAPLGSAVTVALSVTVPPGTVLPVAARLVVVA